MSQIFIYMFQFISILVIQNIFLIIIGDGYVKSKYFHRNNWVKAGDTGIKQDEESEDPLEPFIEHDVNAEKSTKALVKMLRADKEILLTEYYQSRGLQYQPVIYDESKRIKSPEQLTRIMLAELDDLYEDYEDRVNEIQNGKGDSYLKEQKIDEVYTKADLSSKAILKKLNELENYI